MCRASRLRAESHKGEPALKQTNILLTGVGGQGVITAGLLIGNAVTATGTNAVMSEIHGMSQRGGVVTAELRIGDVYGPIIPEGATDLLIGFEAAETIRALKRAGERATVIMSSERIIPPTVTLGEARYPDVEGVVSKLRERGAKLFVVDAPRLAREAGSALSSNVVLVGAACSAGFVPAEREALEKAIRDLFPERSWETNIRALQIGMEEFRRLAEVVTSQMAPRVGP